MVRNILARVAKLPATDRQGARFAVTMAKRRYVVPYDHALNYRENIDRAIGRALAKVAPGPNVVVRSVRELEPCDWRSANGRSGPLHWVAIHLEDNTPFVED
jgi:hypothetical protein